MPRIERDRELAQRRQRKVKMKKLEEKYHKTSANDAKLVIFEKLRRISPLVDWKSRLSTKPE